jgi:hypothetical protein
MADNPITLLDEATSPRIIGVKSVGLQEDKKYLCSFIYGGTRGGAIVLNLRMMHKLAENSYSLQQLEK